MARLEDEHEATARDPESTDTAAQIMRALAIRGALHWNGGRPAGVRGVSVRGRAVSETIIEDRR